MATYVNNLRLKEIATGAESGTWGTSTNTNLELIADAFGSGTEAITTNVDTHTTTIADGAADEGRAIYMKYTGTLDSACTITLAPNDINKFWIVENATSGSQNIIISQGSGANITIGNGKVAAIFTDGAGSGAAVLDAFADLELSSTLTVAGAASLASTLAVTGAITGSSTIQGTTITATTAFVPDASDGAALGTTSLEFSDLYLADGAVIGFGDDQDVTLTHVVDTGLLLSGTSELQFNDGTQYIQAPSATVLDINATDEIELNATAVDLNGTLDVSGTSTLGGTLTVNAGAVFNEGSGDYDFRIEANGEANMFCVDAGNDKIGIGTTTPAGRLEVYMSSSGASPDGDADEFVIETSGSGGISILTGASSSGSILFGDSGDNGRGKVVYNHSTDLLQLSSGGSVGITIDSSQNTIIPATKKFYLDGGSNTYIYEHAADTIRFYCGAEENISLYENDILMPGAGSKIYWDGGIDTYTTLIENNVIGWYCGDTEAMRLTDGAGTITGSWTITGALSKGSGTFKIDHPIKPETHDLIHSFVEGPRADLIYRGVVSLSDGWAEVDLDEAVGLSEGTWAALCRDPQVWVQNTSGWDAVRGSVEGSTLTIECADSGSGDTVSWLVVAERQDDHIRETDWTDDEGHPILEPEKVDG